MSSKNGFQRIQSVLDFMLDKQLTNEDLSNDLVVLGRTYNSFDKDAVDQPVGTEPQSQEADSNTDKASIEEHKENAPTIDRDEESDEDPLTLQTKKSPATKINEGQEETTLQFAHLRLNEIRSFFQRVSSTDKSNSVDSHKQQQEPQQQKTAGKDHKWPSGFLEDVDTRLWLTYRSGFPLIEKSTDGPSPLNFGSFIRGTLDLSTANKGFSSDAGWGCMIRTSQSLLANALLNLLIGRDWRFNGEDRENKNYKKHCEIISWFADVPSAPFSIQNFVEFAHQNCNKRPGEWFGPSSASQSIKGLSDISFKKCGLMAYISNSSGDIYEEELFEDVEDEFGEFRPTLLLCGVRLGVKNVNPIYRDFLKTLLNLKQSVGIAGGRPSSSHYFFGYQGDYLFYLDPHFPQKALVVNDKHENLIGYPYHPELTREEVSTVHTTVIRKLHLDEIDPSMLVGLLIKDKNDYLELKKVINDFDVNHRFLHIYLKRPLVSRSSIGSDLMEESEFVDLGVRSINESDSELDKEDVKSISTNDESHDKEQSEFEGDADDEEYDRVPEGGHSRAFSQPVIITDEETKELLKVAKSGFVPNADTVVISEDEFEEEGEKKDTVMDQEVSVIEKAEAGETFEEIAPRSRLDSEPVILSGNAHKDIPTMTTNKQ